MYSVSSSKMDSILRLDKAARRFAFSFREDVLGIEDESSQIVDELNLYPVQSVPMILELFYPEASSSLTEAINQWVSKATTTTAI